MEFISDVIEQLVYSIKVLNIPKITVFSLIDIALVSYLIYKILIWIKETRAWSLFKGIFVLFFISIIAYIFDLYTVTWIISNTFNVGIIALIVIFQPEIRKALEQLGTTKGVLSISFSEQSNQLSTRSLDAILASATKMAQEGIGAIIAIQNEVPLGEHEVTGIPIDAVITSQLILNIFEDKTPLHDGALIIKNDKISAASCILPLTKKEIGKELGTRHRAGVGLSEVSDAFIIIVSEETKALSLAHSGKIERNITEEDIRKMIRFKRNENGKKNKDKKKRRKLTKKRG